MILYVCYLVILFFVFGIKILNKIFENVFDVYFLIFCIIKMGKNLICIEFFLYCFNRK